MSSVVIAGNTSGSVTLSAPDIAGTTTLTLPSTSGTVVTTNTMPTGSVLQVVSYQTESANISTTSNSYVTTNVSASITPSSSSNKILIMLNSNCDTSASARQAVITFYRGATNLAPNRGINQAYSGAGRLQSSTTSVYLDSPSSTSSTTYTVYFKSTTAGNSVDFATDNLMVSLILMEIKG